MKRLLTTLFAIAMLAPAFISAQEIKRGDVALVPSFTWVTVKNTMPAESGNTTFRYGEKCSIKRGAMVRALGIYGNLVLVRYSIDQIQYGAQCPSGVTFFLEKTEFVGMTAQFNKSLRERREEPRRGLTNGKKA